MATVRAKKAAKIAIENPHLPMRQIMKHAGYSQEMCDNPRNLTESKGWIELMEEFLPDESLTQKHLEQLNAGIIGRLYFDITETDEDVAEVCVQAGVKLLYVKDNKTKNGRYAVIIKPDFFHRDLALDKAYKIKGRYKDVNVNQSLIINVPSTIAEKYGISSSTRSSSS